MYTARLCLRPVRPADRADLVALEADPEVMRYLNGGHPVPEAGFAHADFLTPRGCEPEVLAAHIRGTGFDIGFDTGLDMARDAGHDTGHDIARDTGCGADFGAGRDSGFVTTRFIGWFALFDDGWVDGLKTAELGYRLRREAWGQGYATEGARALVAAAFGRLGFDRVRAQTMAVNAGSRRVLEKAGFQPVGTCFPAFAQAFPGSELGEVVYEVRRPRSGGEPSHTP